MIVLRMKALVVLVVLITASLQSGVCVGGGEGGLTTRDEQTDLGLGVTEECHPHVSQGR